MRSRATSSLALLPLLLLLLGLLPPPPARAATTYITATYAAGGDDALLLFGSGSNRLTLPEGQAFHLFCKRFKNVSATTNGFVSFDRVPTTTLTDNVNLTTATSTAFRDSE
jgi:hypothetical protein